MTHYDVQVHDRRGAMRHVLARVDAASPSEAILLARRTLPVSAAGVELYAVYRRRRLRARKLVGTYPAGDGGDDGLAGVREPRRPHPTPPSLRAEADIPAYPDN